MSFMHQNDFNGPVPAYIRKETLDIRGSKKRKNSEFGPFFSELQLLVKIQSIKRQYDSFELRF